MSKTLTATSIWFLSEFGWYNVLDADEPSSSILDTTVKGNDLALKDQEASND